MIGNNTKCRLKKPVMKYGQLRSDRGYNTSQGHANRVFRPQSTCHENGTLPSEGVINLDVDIPTGTTEVDSENGPRRVTDNYLDRGPQALGIMPWYYENGQIQAEKLWVMVNEMDTALIIRYYENRKQESRIEIGQDSKNGISKIFVRYMKADNLWYNRGNIQR